MKNDFSASASGKTATATGGSSPFDQIAALEAQEAERLQKELEAMEKEESEVAQALKEKDEQVDIEMKNAAKEELKEYRTNELNTIVKSAEKEGQQEAEKLDVAFSSAKKGIVEDLASTALQYK